MRRSFSEDFKKSVVQKILLPGGPSVMEISSKIGVHPTFSRPKVSDDNPYSESLFKTLKYCPEYPSNGGFNSVEEARTWVKKFVEWYNHRHLHSGIKFVTPHDRHKSRVF